MPRFSLTNLAVLLVIAGCAAAAVTALVRRAALRRSVLDVPNERSLHTVATPRGGGIAIAIVSFVGITLLAVLGALPTDTAVGIVGGGLLVAASGLADDLRRVPAWVRVLCHIAAAMWLVAWVGGVTQLRFGSAELPLGPAGWLIAVLGVAWMINLYNFMDGIDGLAAGEAVVVASVGGLGLLSAGQSGLGTAALIVAAASAGFLVFNWPPARIFMGDVGSGLLGFLLAGFGLASEHAGGPAALTWALLLGVFVVDATVTLIRRMVRGEQWYRAHCSHAYQRAVQSGWSHARVTGVALLITAMLAALGWAGERQPSWTGAIWIVGLALLLFAYLSVEHRRPMPPEP